MHGDPVGRGRGVISCQVRAYARQNVMMGLLTPSDLRTKNISPCLVAEPRHFKPVCLVMGD